VIGWPLNRTSAMGSRIVNVVNGRRILEHDPIGHHATLWYSIELRGPEFKGEPIEVWQGPFASLADAVSEAERRGPIPDAQET
jgi:hypothetical protein